MFRITRDTSSGSVTQYLVKITRNGSVVSFDMDVVGVLAAYCDQLCMHHGQNMLRPCQRTRQNHFL